MHRELEKFECADCGCHFWVPNRNDFDCPNCDAMAYAMGLEEIIKDEKDVTIYGIRDEYGGL